VGIKKGPVALHFGKQWAKSHAIQSEGAKATEIPDELLPAESKKVE